MKKNYPIFVIIVLVFAVRVPAFSQINDDCKTVSVAAAEVPHFVESENKGVFIDLVREGAARSDLELTISVYPKKRALLMFEAGQVAALLPHSSAGAKVTAYKSVPLYIRRNYAFVRRGSQIPNSIEALEDLNVGLTAQYAYSESLTTNKKIVFANEPVSDEINIKMLSAGRHDVSIIEEISGLKAISNAGVDNIVYDKNQPISEMLVWMLFGKNECGKKQSEMFNTAFSSMKADGSWDAIFSRSKK